MRHKLYKEKELGEKKLESKNLVVAWHVTEVSKNLNQSDQLCESNIESISI